MQSSLDFIFWDDIVDELVIVAACYIGWNQTTPVVMNDMGDWAERIFRVMLWSDAFI
jgi:hypothetical protein